MIFNIFVIDISLRNATAKISNPIESLFIYKR